MGNGNGHALRPDETGALPAAYTPQHVWQPRHTSYYLWETGHPAVILDTTQIYFNGLIAHRGRQADAKILNHTLLQRPRLEFQLETTTVLPNNFTPRAIAGMHPHPV
jgi:hypothetical protein